MSWLSLSKAALKSMNIVKVGMFSSIEFEISSVSSEIALMVEEFFETQTG